MTKPAILIVDDTDEVIAGITSSLQKCLPADAVDINSWSPSTSDEDPEKAFQDRCEARTVLVVTDYDLTTKGLRGLFGPSIVAWSQNAAIPVGDFSRGKKQNAQAEPNLFELRVPSNDAEAGPFIANLFEGFQSLRAGLSADDAALKARRNMAATLAELLGRPNLESQFTLYMARLGAANSSLLDSIRKIGAESEPDTNEIAHLMTYIMGHVLANSVLRFPGPLLSGAALCAYCACSIDEAAALAPSFEAALYAGPFSGLGPYYWRDDVDRLLDAGLEALGEVDASSFAESNRAVVEVWLKRTLKSHDCDRCGGTRGGFWCPFKLRPVCDRSDCSVPSSSWVPQGAQLTRVERDFYDELSPLLGL